jgi:RimJ/RimL family protein N-acetyltransferase
MSNISTPRLELIPLSISQLELCLTDLPALEGTLGIRIDRDFITERVRRALGMKIAKMKNADDAQHAWLTYWLLVVREEKIGAGMLGYKGYPNESGSTEIGYGIAPAYQGKGLMGEAVQALIDWAFTHSFCRTVTASEVENSASRRLLEKLGAELVEQTPSSTSWKFPKK